MKFGMSHVVYIHPHYLRETRKLLDGHMLAIELVSRKVYEMQ